MLSTATTFQRYQEIRHRLPPPPQIKSMLDIENLTDISMEAGAFVFDAFGRGSGTKLLKKSRPLKKSVDPQI